MPEKVEPSVLDFEHFSTKLLKMGFRKFGVCEFKKQFARLGLKAPRQQTGREVGFVFYANELTVFVWTTWLDDCLTIRQSDAGWVLIIQNKRTVYFAGPFRRTKSFFLSLLRYAWAAKHRVVNRPLCPECKKYMRIVRGRALKARYWFCDNRLTHTSRKNTNLDWDYGLPPKAKRFFDQQRKKKAKYRASLKVAGKPLHQAMLRRKQWVITRPENRIFLR